MTVGILPQYQRYCLAFSRASGVLVVALAVAVLIGWDLDLPVLKSGIPGLIAMNPVTAIAFSLAGCGLLLLLHADGATAYRRACRACAVAVVVLPLLCLSRLYLPWDLGPDRLLFPGRVAIPLAGFPNRMAPMTGVDFVLLGVTLLLFTFSSVLTRRLASALATAAGLIALIVIVTYGYELQSLSSVGGLIPVALNTAIAFLVLAAGVLSARPANGVVALFISDRVGGRLARRLLPAAVIIPLTIGWLEQRGEDRGWYNGAGGDAIVAIATTLIFLWVIWRSAIVVDRADNARTRAEAKLRDLNQHLEIHVLERTHELERANQDLHAEVRARCRAEEDLRRTADELRGWFDTSPLAICSMTPDNRVRSWNRAAEILFGWAAGEVLGQQLPIVAGGMGAEADDFNDQVLAGVPVMNVETQRLHKDGNPVDVSISAAALHDADGKTCGVVAVYASIGERKLLELQLRQAQKMEAIGRLAGGVAHDFNNILTVIQAAAEFLRGDLEPDDHRRAEAVEIVNAAHRASKLTRQLLAFSRQQLLELQVLDINTVVRPLEPMLRRLLETNIELLFRLGADLDPVKADPNQLDQVILNLVVNARDAMTDGGTVLIETSKVVLDAEYAHGHISARPGPHVVLSITDSGVGMNAETQARIFEPFFTTKTIGKGTGLGLAMVYGIVKQLGGHIWVYSEPGHGTTFKIYLPSYTGSDPVRGPATSQQVGAITFGARILLVEDDAAVRSAVKRMLERHQYVVTAVASGDEALARFGKVSDSVDLVLSDMMMPGISGLELRHRLRDLGATVPMLLMSGYSEAAIGRSGNGDELAPHIEKPFTVDQLVSKVEQLLRAPRGVA